jgi:hypothetical protein
MTKSFRLQAQEIRQIVTEKGWCIASDRITVHELHVGYMYRELTDDDGDVCGRTSCRIGCVYGSAVSRGRVELIGVRAARGACGHTVT